jgi:hypothetical protein
MYDGSSLHFILGVAADCSFDEGQLDRHADFYGAGRNRPVEGARLRGFSLIRRNFDLDCYLILKQREVADFRYLPSCFEHKNLSSS